MRVIPDTIDLTAYLQKPADAIRVRPASAFADLAHKRFDDPEYSGGPSLPWSKLAGKVAIRKGELSIWAGKRGEGKSLLLSQVMLKLMRRHKVCIASMEMKPDLTLQRLIRQAAASNHPSRDWINRFLGWTDDRLWLYDQQGSVEAKRMVALVRYCAEEMGIEQFVIDSLMKCGIAPDDYAGQKQFVNDLHSIAQDTGMHIHLVAHGRKSETGRMSSGDDVKGASEIVDQTDNCYFVMRNREKEKRVYALERDGQDAGAHDASEPDAFLRCDKQRNGDWEGTVGLWLHHMSGTFTETADRHVSGMLLPVASEATDYEPGAA